MPARQLACFLTAHNLEGPIGLALSGGGDSIALLYLLMEVLPPEKIMALHFNHNTRAESSDDAQWVQNVCEKEGIKCLTESWEASATTGNFHQQARRARYAFFSRAAQNHQLQGILTAHTQDDVAETVLMRLGKGSGLKGLAGIQSKRIIQNTPIYRPLLDTSRQDLRNYLEKHNASWLEDPANMDDAYQRARLRKLRPQLEKAGVDFSAIAASAQALQRAQAAISNQVAHLKNTCIKESAGDITISTDFLKAPQEVQLQLLGTLLVTLSNTPMPPRSSKRQALLEKMVTGKLPATLGGVKITGCAHGFHLTPENKARAPKPQASKG